MALHVKRLGARQSAHDVDLNTAYVALYRAGRLQLNRDVAAESMERLDENTEYPVYVSRVIDAQTVVANVINEPFVAEGREADGPGRADGYGRAFEERRERPGGRGFREGFRDGMQDHRGRPDRRGGYGREEHRRGPRLPRRGFDSPREGSHPRRESWRSGPRREAWEAPPLAETLLIPSDSLSQLLPRLQLAAVRLQRAVANAEPIILRFHADTDGYAAATALDRALLPFLARVHGDRAWQSLIRSPSKTPFYHVEDAARDLTAALRESRRPGDKLPLLVILDNGSTPEDVLGLKLVAQYGLSVIVLDHHDPGPLAEGRCAADPYISVHINPHLVGASSGLSSGILAVELAHLLAPETPLADLAALSGTADRSQTPEYAAYLELAGRPREHFSRLAACVDFAAFTLRHLDSPALMRDLLGADGARQTKLMDVLSEEIERQRTLMEPIVRAYAEKKKFGAVTLLRLDAGAATLRGEFYSLAKTVRLMHDLLRDGPTVSVGFAEDTVVFRADEVPGFDANDLIRELAKGHPQAGASGGGHAYAASLRFVPAARGEVLAFIESYLKNL